MASSDEPDRSFAAQTAAADMVRLSNLNRENLLRFLVVRTGSRQKAAEVLDAIGEAIAAGRLQADGPDALAALYRFGADQAARQRAEARASLEDGSPASRQARRDQLLHALRGLPPDVFQVIEMHKLQRKSIQATAAALNISADAVRRRLQQGLVQLVDACDAAEN